MRAVVLMLSVVALHGCSGAKVLEPTQVAQAEVAPEPSPVEAGVVYVVEPAEPVDPSEPNEEGVIPLFPGPLMEGQPRNGYERPFPHNGSDCSFVTVENVKQWVDAWRAWRGFVRRHPIEGVVFPTYEGRGQVGDGVVFTLVVTPGGLKVEGKSLTHREVEAAYDSWSGRLRREAMARMRAPKASKEGELAVDARASLGEVRRANAALRAVRHWPKTFMLMRGPEELPHGVEPIPEALIERAKAVNLPPPRRGEKLPQRAYRRRHGRALDAAKGECPGLHDRPEELSGYVDRGTRSVSTAQMWLECGCEVDLEMLVVLTETNGNLPVASLRRLELTAKAEGEVEEFPDDTPWGVVVESLGPGECVDVLAVFGRERAFMCARE